MRKPETIEREISEVRARLEKSREAGRACRERIQALTTELRATRKASKKAVKKSNSLTRSFQVINNL